MPRIQARQPMKRTGFKPRSKPLRSKSFSKTARINKPRAKPKRKNDIKRKPRKNGKPKLLRDFHERFHFCFTCERRICEVFPRSKGPHHIAFGKFGASRVDAVWNLAALCGECHQQYHDGKGVTDRMILEGKEKHDPENYNEAFLRKLRPSLFD